MSHSSQNPAPPWQPPSASLQWRDGLWRSRSATPVSYPKSGSEVCLQVEDDSYWFRHRMDCLRTVVGLFPPRGTIYDIGGGNGFVSLGLQNEGHDIVLLEPGPGARHALRRGVRQVIESTLDDARLAPHSLPAAGAFDVLEHIADDEGFLRTLKVSLRTGGRFYCTVPAGLALWSEEDGFAGHYRRYTRETLQKVLARAGFTVEYLTPFFAWLVLPVLLFRVVPTRLGLKNPQTVAAPETFRAEHRLPGWLGWPVNRAQGWELRRLRAGRPIAMGTSLLAVARAAG